MRKAQLKQVNPISKRANCKLVRANNRNFIIGGMTADTVTNDIIQFRINSQGQQTSVEYKYIKLDNKLFTPRNSFAVCSKQSKIFIWGGLELNSHSQRCLDDLIEFDVQTHTLRKYPVQKPFVIHSSVLSYDQSANKLIAYGGTDQKNSFQSFLYFLDLNLKDPEWTRTRIQCKQHQGIIWQHSAHLSHTSILNKQITGSFLIIVGGCREPQAPYPYIIEININKKQVSGFIKLDVGLVSQDSILTKDGSLYIFGGSVGGDFNRSVYRVSNGKYDKIENFMGIGCACLQVKQGLVVYGGLSGIQNLNSMVLYANQDQKLIE